MYRGWVTLFWIFFILYIMGNNKAHEHHEDKHDVDEFEAEFGDEKPGNEFSEGTEEDHIELREQSGFVKPKAVHNAKDLPPLNFLYCVSCGYKQAFEQFSQVVRDKYPNIQIEGSNYPPVLWKAYVAQAISILKLVVLGIIISGSNPFEALGYGYPSILQHAHGNKLSTCMMVFMLSNLAEQSLISTGAFEIYLGTEQIWSKIDSGRVPSPQELIQLIDAQLAILGKGPAISESFGDFSNKL
ncbi:unnamed protein product [Caenorhabditis bovis]|uniref:SelT-like protein n=1 Tax=Caenorhabditis bovis TaxID=2654633 RepID=A0A8S1FD80_9PELO|nr:unnamed protein product [Caenorhabditis bovis]